jgi:hypothetical protein
LLDRSLQSGSCGGVHLITAACSLSRADEQHPVLSEGIQKGLRERVRRCIEVAVRTQRADGSWPTDWNTELLPGGIRRGRSPLETASGRLLVTSHLAEWLLSLPKDTAVTKALDRSAKWLAARLGESTEEGRRLAFCPYTHAACVVRRLAIPPGDHQVVPPQSVD